MSNLRDVTTWICGSLRRKCCLLDFSAWVILCQTALSLSWRGGCGQMEKNHYQWWFLLPWWLGGGFNYCLIWRLPGEMMQFGWNHQPDSYFSPRLTMACAQFHASISASDAHCAIKCRQSTWNLGRILLCTSMIIIGKVVTLPARDSDR